MPSRAGWLSYLSLSLYMIHGSLFPFLLPTTLLPFSTIRLFTSSLQLNFQPHLFTFAMSTSDNSPHSPSRTFDSGTPSLTFSSTESSVSVSSAEPGPNFVFSAFEYESESKFLHFVIQELEIWHQKNLSSPEPGHTVYQFAHLPISLGELLFTEIDKRFRLR